MTIFLREDHKKLIINTNMMMKKKKKQQRLSRNSRNDELHKTKTTEYKRFLKVV